MRSGTFDGSRHFDPRIQLDSLRPRAAEAPEVGRSCGEGVRTSGVRAPLSFNEIVRGSRQPRRPGPSPLDRWFCAPSFRRVCPSARSALHSTCALSECNACARRSKLLADLYFFKAKLATERRGRAQAVAVRRQHVGDGQLNCAQTPDITAEIARRNAQTNVSLCDFKRCAHAHGTIDCCFPRTELPVSKKQRRPTS